MTGSQLLSFSPCMSIFDHNTRCPVFCIAEIPTTILDRLLDCTDEYWEEFNSANLTTTASDTIAFINAKDITEISNLLVPSRPTSLSPTAFIGDTLQEVRDWFDTNITQAEHPAFMPYCFFVLDKQSAEDETCLFVCTQDAPLQFLRCHFDIAMQCAVVCDNGQAIDESTEGRFMRSGVIMTKANAKLVMDGGLYIEGGEVKLDEYWRYLGLREEEEDSSDTPL
ncbi:hypothetical protein CPB84DRAFT_1960882, partial [Gymnopilus junonius]